MTIGPDDDLETRRNDILEAVASVEMGQGVIILTDMFGGTPSNLAISLMRPGKVEEYRFGLPNVDHVFLPGHRIMVQVQSSLFPLYDRNPQTYVPNIFHAKAGDYRAATQRVFYGGATPSAVLLPIVP